MSSRTCPDWPTLMELAPDLQFKHYTVSEAQLPVDALTEMTQVSLGDVAICCDLDHHVFNAALAHWFEVREYAERSPGASAA
jgi:hypothetical protein